MNISKTTELLRYDFTDDEKKELASEMAQAITDLNTAENDKKAVMSDYKSKIDAFSAKASNIAGKLQSGWEMRNIDCRVEKDYRKRIAKIYREDTGEFVKERRIPDDECQMNLEDAAAADACTETECQIHNADVNRCKEGFIFDNQQCKAYREEIDKAKERIICDNEKCRHRNEDETCEFGLEKDSAECKKAKKSGKAALTEPTK